MSGKHAGPVVTGLFIATERWAAAQARDGRLNTRLDRRGRHVTDSYEERVNRTLRAKMFAADAEAVAS